MTVNFGAGSFIPAPYMRLLALESQRKSEERVNTEGERVTKVMEAPVTGVGFTDLHAPLFVTRILWISTFPVRQ